MSTAYTHAIILDFEATCDDRKRPNPQEIIEFPSVLLALETREIVDEFSSFVRPHHHPVLSAFCRELTSIRQEETDAAATFPEVLAAHEAWLKGHGLTEQNALFVTCGDWDLGTMLPAQCPAAVPPVECLRPVYTRWQNIKRAFCAVKGVAKAPGMAGMLRDVDLPLQGHHHRGIDDCRNLAELYRVLLERGATLEVTAELPLSKYPPVTIRLRLGERVEEVRLTGRSVHALRGLAGRTFKCPITELRRSDQSIEDDHDLAFLTSGAEIVLVGGG